METFIYHYGYLAILIGAIVEGEAILLLGGFAAHAGYLALPWVIVAAFFGTLFGDQAYFFIGRWHSQRILAARPAWKARVDRAEKLFKKFRTPLILIFRFLYGIRTVVLFVVGMSPIPTTKFAILNALGAMIWAVAVGVAGYLFGSALESLLGDIRHYQLSAFGALAAIGFLVFIARFAWKRWGKK